jgi:hypothetical protein
MKKQRKISRAVIYLAAAKVAFKINAICVASSPSNDAG